MAIGARTPAALRAGSRRVLGMASPVVGGVTGWLESGRSRVEAGEEAGEGRVHDEDEEADGEQDLRESELVGALAGVGLFGGELRRAHGPCLGGERAPDGGTVGGGQAAGVCDLAQFVESPVAA